MTRSAGSGGKDVRTATTEPTRAQTGAVVSSAPSSTLGEGHEEEAGALQGGLFGRGLLYVAVWALQLVTSTAVSPVLVHVLPADQFGVLSAAIAVSQVLVLLAVFGLDQVLVLVRAEPGGELRARALLTQGAVVAAALTGLAWGTRAWWGAALHLSGHGDLLGVIALWTLPSASVTLSLLLLVAADRLRAFAVLSVTLSTGAPLAGLAYLLGSRSRSAVTYAEGVLVAIVVAALLGTILSPPSRRGLLDLPLARRAATLGLPLLMSSLCVYVMSAGDRLVLARMAGSVPVARYQVAYTVGSVLMLLLNATNTLWSPRLTAVRDPIARWRTIERSREGLVNLLVPAFLGLVLASPLLLRVVAPTRLAPEELMTTVLLVAVASFAFVMQISAARVQVTLHMTRTIAAVALVSAILNIALNVAFIPIWGVTGSAAATTVSFAVQALLQQVTLPRGTLSGRLRPGVLVQVGLVSAAAVVWTLAAPRTTTWQIGGFLAAVACLPWFAVRTRRLVSAER